MLPIRLSRNKKGKYSKVKFVKICDIGLTSPLCLPLSPSSFYINLSSGECPIIIGREGGENIKYIQTQLGHSNPTDTWNVYAHLMKPANQEAACRLENTVFGESGSRMVVQGKKLKNKVSKENR
jgi:hypothetical protein